MPALFEQLPAVYFVKQFFVGLLFACVSVFAILIFGTTGKAILAGIGILALFNTLLYPYSHIVQNRFEQYLRSGSRNDETQLGVGDVEVGNNDAVEDFIASAIIYFLLRIAIAIGYVLIYALIGFTFWIFSIPLAPVAMASLRARPFVAKT